MQDLIHMLELADLIAYENNENGDGAEHVVPTYIGRHKTNIKDSDG